MQEIWIKTEVKGNRLDVVTEFSNMGRVKLKCGQIMDSDYRYRIRFNGKRDRIYRFIAEVFIPKTEQDIELGRNEVDHITHNPNGMNINDVRNLRWCTHLENCNYDEHCKVLSEACKGRPSPRKGVTLTDETRAKLRAAWERRRLSHKSALA